MTHEPVEIKSCYSCLGPNGVVPDISGLLCVGCAAETISQLRREISERIQRSDQLCNAAWDVMFGTPT